MTLIRGRAAPRQGQLIAPIPPEGGWKNGEIDGEGVATYANGDVYTGYFVMGKRQGTGASCSIGSGRRGRAEGQTG